MPGVDYVMDDWSSASSSASSSDSDVGGSGSEGGVLFAPHEPRPPAEASAAAGAAGAGGALQQHRQHRRPHRRSEAPPPLLGWPADLEAVVRAAISDLGGAVVPKLHWSAPKVGMRSVGAGGDSAGGDLGGAAVPKMHRISPKVGGADAARGGERGRAGGGPMQRRAVWPGLHCGSPKVHRCITYVFRDRAEPPASERCTPLGAVRPGLHRGAGS